MFSQLSGSFYNLQCSTFSRHRVSPYLSTYDRSSWSTFTLFSSSPDRFKVVAIIWSKVTLCLRKYSFSSIKLTNKPWRSLVVERDKALRYDTRLGSTSKIGRRTFNPWFSSTYKHYAPQSTSYKLLTPADHVRLHLSFSY